MGSKKKKHSKKSREKISEVQIEEEQPDNVVENPVEEQQPDSLEQVDEQQPEILEEVNEQQPDSLDVVEAEATTLEEEEDKPDYSDKTVGKNEYKHDHPKKFDKKRHQQQVYSRVKVDPSRNYRQPEERESWGPNVKGKKFRKEKGKKKRCPNAGVRIDGSVNSVRLDM